jgi:nitrate/nitrite transporter NarK
MPPSSRGCRTAAYVGLGLLTTWVLHRGVYFFRCVLPHHLGNGGDFFGRRYFATIRGMMSFVYMWGSFAGPVLAGAIYDRTQSYMIVLWILLCLLTVATLLVSFLIRGETAKRKITEWRPLIITK